MNNFYIKKFIDASEITDKKGRVLNKIGREFSSIIFTFKGQIKFSNSQTTVYSNETYAVYLPQNSDYTNTCLENAESYMFSFIDSNQSTEIRNIQHLDLNTIQNYFKLINSIDKNTEQFKILSILYSILDSITVTTLESPYIKRAKKYIFANYNKNISINTIADNIGVSGTYLSKLFKTELNTSVFKFLTKIRMEKAFTLIKENRQISEIALSVGYNDIYQFSRAYKKFFGKSPKNYR